MFTLIIFRLFQNEKNPKTQKFAQSLLLSALSSSELYTGAGWDEEIWPNIGRIPTCCHQSVSEE